MSVAFRRESDEEHKEPRFELPIPSGPNLVTEHGLALIREQVDALEAAVVAEADAAACDALRRDLRYWTTRLTTAEIAPPPEPGETGIGSRVRIRLAGAERDLHIVGHDEADPDAGRIAFSAPLARAVMGAMAGERADFNGALEAVEVLEVTP